MALISKIIRFIYFFCIINNMRQQIPAKLPLDIRPSDYNQKHSKQLGNHFIYAKLSNNQKWNDARLKVLQPSYFLGRSVLDIGCNQGILAIPIAVKFQPKLVKGIDIDIEMTKKAKTNIETFKSKAMNHNYPKQIISQISTLPRYFKQKISKIFGETVLQLSNNHEIRPKDIKPQNMFPTNIQIINDNIFSYRDVDKFDCVLCMNMTKWIHLAFGDEGIKQLFMQVQRISNDGAIFVLESHPWSSYRKKKNMFDSYKYNYRMILLKPDRFKDLLQKLGFELIETISPSADNGLKHEILVFQKKSSLKSKDYF